MLLGREYSAHLPRKQVVKESSIFEIINDARTPGILERGGRQSNVQVKTRDCMKMSANLFYERGNKSSCFGGGGVFECFNYLKGRVSEGDTHPHPLPPHPPLLANLPIFMEFCCR